MLSGDGLHVSSGIHPPLDDDSHDLERAIALSIGELDPWAKEECRTDNNFYDYNMLAINYATTITYDNIISFLDGEPIVPEKYGAGF